ncbi:MAG: hypothetical protein ACE5JA_00665 [bacterium]
MRSRFPLVEIAIVLVAAALIYILERPRHEANVAEQHSLNAVYNLYVYKAAIEKYTAYNNGVYPTSPDSVELFLEGGDRESGKPGRYPLNPYTGQILSKKDIGWTRYNNIGDSRDQSPNGPNGSRTGAPGTISAAWFIPPGETLAVEYGLITFGEDFTPVFRVEPSGEKRIIVIHD